MAISFAISSSMCFNIFGWFWVQSPLAKRHLDSTHSSAAQKQDQTLLTKEYQHLKFHLVLALQGSLVGTSAEGKDIFFKALINVPAFFFHSPMPCLFDSVWFVHEGKGTWGGQMYLSTNVTCSTWQDTLLIPGVALFFFFFFFPIHGNSQQAKWTGITHDILPPTSESLLVELGWSRVLLYHKGAYSFSDTWLTAKWMAST